jgi:hypothetical protein
MKLIPMDGQTFGRLTVGEHAGNNRFGNAMWTVNCDCGSPPFTVNGRDLRRGHTVSCGCYFREMMVKQMQKLKFRQARQAIVRAAFKGTNLGRKNKR